MFQLSYAQTHRGIKKKVNEDAFLKMPNHGVWAVADGMGGHPAGDVASQLIVDDLEKVVNATNIHNLNCQIILNSLQHSNEKLLILADKEFPGMTVGSTIVILFIKDGTSSLLWGGDSRGYLFRGNKLKLLTRDHTQVNDMIDNGMINPSDVDNHPLRHVITRAVGVGSDLNIEIVKHHLQENDIFLLCSDGLTKEMTDLDIEQVLLQSVSIVDSGMALMHASLVRNARDNITCILINYRSGNYLSLESNVMWS